MKLIQFILITMVGGVREARRADIRRGYLIIYCLYDDRDPIFSDEIMFGFTELVLNYYY